MAVRHQLPAHPLKPLRQRKARLVQRLPIRPAVNLLARVLTDFLLIRSIVICSISVRTMLLTCFPARLLFTSTRVLVIVTGILTLIANPPKNLVIKKN